MSQSPQTGQFNSYGRRGNRWKRWVWVSIPSNGSIQFLRCSTGIGVQNPWWVSIPSNGSIQFLHYYISKTGNPCLSQSPQTGQFNSYGMKLTCPWLRQAEKSLNPLKRVNSILTRHELRITLPLGCIMSQSPQTGQFNSYQTLKRGKT